MTPNGNLLLDEERVSYECYCLGYFGLVGNVDITLMDNLDFFCCDPQRQFAAGRREGQL